MNKQEKISLLKALLSGKITIEALKYKKLKIIIRPESAEGGTFYINDVEVSASGYVEELQKQIQNDPNFNPEVGIIEENNGIRWL